MSKRPHLVLDNYLPYLINRVGSAVAETYTAQALDKRNLSLAMWRVLAALSSNGEQRQIDLVAMTSIDDRSSTPLAPYGTVTKSGYSLQVVPHLQHSQIGMQHCLVDFICRFS